MLAGWEGKETPLVRKSIGSASVRGGCPDQDHFKHSGGAENTQRGPDTRTGAAGSRAWIPWTASQDHGLGRARSSGMQQQTEPSSQGDNIAEELLAYVLKKKNNNNKELLFLTCTVGAANVIAMGMCQREAVCCLRVGGFA